MSARAEDDSALGSAAATLELARGTRYVPLRHLKPPDDAPSAPPPAEPMAVDEQDEEAAAAEVRRRETLMRMMGTHAAWRVAGCAGPDPEREGEPAQRHRQAAEPIT